MTSKTRNFVLASLMVLAAGLGTGLVAYYVGFPMGAASRQAGPEELRFLPPNVALVASADVHAIMTSPLRDRLHSVMNGRGNGRDEFTNQTGINIDTDIDRVVAAFSAPAADAHEGDAVVLARGRFDVVKIEGLMREHGGRVEDVDGKRLIVGESKDGKHAVSLAFMEPGLIAVGGASMVRSAVSLSKGGANVTSNDQIMNLVRDLDSGHAWAVGRFDQLTASTALPPAVADKLAPLQWFSASVSVDTGLRGMLRAETRDEASANSLRDVVRGVMALARLQTSAHPQVETALQSITLGGTGTTVSIGFDVPSELFDMLVPKADAARPNVQR